MIQDILLAGSPDTEILYVQKWCSKLFKIPKPDIQANPLNMSYLKYPLVN